MCRAYRSIVLNNQTPVALIRIFNSLGKERRLPIWGSHSFKSILSISNWKKDKYNLITINAPPMLFSYYCLLLQSNYMYNEYFLSLWEKVSDRFEDLICIPHFGLMQYVMTTPHYMSCFAELSR